MEEQRIISRLFARQEDALAELQAELGSRVQRTARNILPSEADAQECVNDTFLAVWHSIPPQRPLSLTAYVLRICKNLAVSQMRRLTAQKRSGYALALDELQEAIGTCSLEETMAAKELGQAIDAYLSTLNRENRALFLCRYWHGDSIPSLVKQFGISQGAISTRLSRIRQGLREYLTKEGLL